MSKKIIYIKLKTGCEPIEKFEESYDLYKKVIMTLTDGFTV